MRRFKVIKKILALLEYEDIALFTTGMIGREAFFAKDRESNFYMIGSMGLASSVGLGIAMNTERRVFVFDGDGSALMDLGTMAMIGALKPRNLIHIVLDNESYQSTGGQPTISNVIDLAKIAISCNYVNIFKITDAKDLENVFSEKIYLPGPNFILIKISNSTSEDVPRVGHSPEKIRDRIINILVNRGRRI
jgi:thiamine pyrophosphate-dependent acetolactate synthase large subunit-like protein